MDTERTAVPRRAGTRGPLDTVEIPSHTLEHFCLDPRVLATFARHKGTGQALPPEFVDAVCCWGWGWGWSGVDVRLGCAAAAACSAWHIGGVPSGQCTTLSVAY